jgi:hypothetical protein
VLVLVVVVVVGLRYSGGVHSASVSVGRSPGARERSPGSTLAVTQSDVSSEKSGAGGSSAWGARPLALSTLSTPFFSKPCASS